MNEEVKTSAETDLSSPLSSLTLSPSLLFPSEKRENSHIFIPLQKVNVTNLRARQRALSEHASLLSAYRTLGLAYTHKSKLCRFAELIPTGDLTETGRLSLVSTIHCQLLMTEFELATWYCLAVRAGWTEQRLWFAALAAKHLCTPESDLICEAVAGKWRINVEEYKLWRERGGAAVSLGEVNCCMETLGRRGARKSRRLVDYNDLVTKMGRSGSD